MYKTSGEQGSLYQRIQLANSKLWETLQDRTNNLVSSTNKLQYKKRKKEREKGTPID